jgi:hypothetical protein
MNFTLGEEMKKLNKTLSLIGLLVLTLACFSGSAMANGIDYSTIGTFSCNGAANCSPASGSSITIGSATDNFTINFISGSGANISGFPFSTATLGTFQTSVNGAGAAFPSSSPFATFMLTINQTSPTGGTGNISGTLVGNIQLNNSTGELEFVVSNPTVAIDMVTYTLLTSNVGGVNFISIKMPATNSNGDTGLTTLDGRVSVPEPASLALMGSGLLVGGSFVRRKLGIGKS